MAHLNVPLSFNPFDLLNPISEDEADAIVLLAQVYDLNPDEDPLMGYIRSALTVHDVCNEEDLNTLYRLFAKVNQCIIDFAGAAGLEGEERDEILTDFFFKFYANTMKLIGSWVTE